MITTVTVIVAWSQSRRIAQVPQHRRLLWALICLNVGYGATVIEGLASAPLASLIDHVEHLGYLGHTVLLALWCWSARRGQAGGEGQGADAPSARPHEDARREA